MPDHLVTEDDRTDPAGNLALDEAVLRAVPATALLRTWQNAQSVIIGRGQRLEREVDVSAAARDGVEVLRRATGGGTVYNDLGNLNITLALPGRGHAPLRLLGRVLHGAVRRLGLRPEITARGLFVGGAKLSGFAAFRTGQGALAHATLLVHTPASAVTTYLLPAPPQPHPLDSHRSPVASLADHGRGVAVAEATVLILATAGEVLGQLHRRPPGVAELEWRERLLHTRYRDADWHLSGNRKSDPNEEGTWRRQHGETSTARWC